VLFLLVHNKKLLAKAQTST